MGAYRAVPPAFARIHPRFRTPSGRRGALGTEGVLPMLGGLMRLAAFVLSCLDYADPAGGETVISGIGGVIGIGSLVLGAILMIVTAASRRRSTARRSCPLTPPSC